MTRRPVRTVALALSLAASALAGCAAPPGNLPPPACAWDLRAVGSQLAPGSPTNIVFPDTSANYWVTPVPIDGTRTVTISGGDIAARYWSIQTYTASDLFGSTLDSVNDGQVTRTSGGSWRVTLTPAGNGTAGDDELRGLPEGQPSGVTWVMFRTYLSADELVPAGAAELPRLAVHENGRTTDIPTCAQPPLDEPFDPSGVQTSGSFPTWLPQPAMKFQRTVPAVTPFPNGDSAYIATTAARREGHVVSITATAPRSAVPGETDPQVRYWSWCQFGLPSTSTVACLNDSQIPLDAEGRYTIVISDPRDRPATATTANGVAWMPWGHEVIGAFALRNLLPSPDFDNAAQAVPPGTEATVDTMGEYLPVASMCSTAEFDASPAHVCPQ